MDYSKLSDEELKALYDEDYSKLSDETLKKLVQNTSSDTPIEKSPLSIAERMRMGFGDVEGNLKYLQEKYGKENVRMANSGTSYLIKTDKGWQKSDPQGMNIKNITDLSKNIKNITDLPADVLEILLPTAIDAAAQAGGVTVGGLSGNVPGAVAGAAGGAAVGNAINQGIGNALGVRDGFNASEDILSAVLGGGIPAVAPLGASVKNALKKPIAKGALKVAQVLNSPEFIDKFSGLQEFLTSVPKDYVEKALKAELDGNSMLIKGKEVKNAYDNIVNNLQKLKTNIKPVKYYDKQFNELANKTKEALIKLQNSYDVNFTNMIGKVDDPKNFLSPEEYIKLTKNANYQPLKLNGDEIEKDLRYIVNSFAHGATVNPETSGAGGIKIANTFNQLNNAKNSEKGLKLQDLHNLKEDIYNKVNYEAKGGDNALKAMAEHLNNILRKHSPEYAKANDAYAKLKAVEKESTLKPENKLDNLADKLSKLNTSEAIKSGLYDKFKLVDDLMPKEDKFLDRAIEYTQRADIDKRLLKDINKPRFEKYPRQLGNLTDAESESLKILEDRYNSALKSNEPKIDILEELENARINEEMNRMLPGQGGGSGSGQGFMNNVVRPGIRDLSKGAAGFFLGSKLAGPIGGALGVTAVTPKIMTKGTIKNIGKINANAQKIMADVLNKTPIEAPAQNPWTKAYQSIIYGLTPRKVLTGRVSIDVDKNGNPI